MRPANVGIRSLAALIDSVVVCVLWYWFIEAWGTASKSIDTTSLQASFTNDKMVTGVPALVLLLATTAYWMVPEWLFSVTPGKLLCGLKVVTLHGKKITLAQSINRNLLRLIDFFAFYLVGFLVAKLTPNHQRLGDLWAKTLVIKTSDVLTAPENSSPKLVNPD